MITNEYLTVKDLSRMHKLGIRQIRKIIDKLTLTTGIDLLHKDKNSHWRIHHILASKFKAVKPRKCPFYALTVDLCDDYTEKDINGIMGFVCSNMQNENIEINYVIEQKKANNRSHLHCYINCKQKKKLLENLRIGFSKMNYKENSIYDLEGWVNYITKTGKKITTLKN